jgi:hypothetical protein
MAMEVKQQDNGNITIWVDENKNFELSKLDFMKLAGRVSAMAQQMMTQEKIPNSVKTVVDCPF